MVGRCCVPNCNSKSVQNISLFAIPKDERLRKQWVKTIPGVISLKSNQRVCEKHFVKNVIIRSYAPTTKTGEILFEIPFKKPRLAAGAIPSIFDNDATIVIDSHILLSDHTYSIPVVLDGTTNNESKIIVDNELISQESDINRSSNIDNTDENAEIQETGTIINDITERTGEKKAMSGNEQDAMNLTNLLQNDMNIKKLEVTTDCDIDTNLGELQVASDCIIDTNIGESQVANDCKIDANVRESQVATDCNTDTNTSTKITFTQQISFEFDKIDGDISPRNLLSLEIPKPWFVSKCLIAREEALVFSYIVETKDANLVLEKSVIVKRSRQMIYKVHNCTANVIDAKFPLLLENINSLSETLRKFKNLRICKGIKQFEDLIITNASVVRDSLGELRHKNCPLMSLSRERCSLCLKLNKNFYLKIMRMKKQKNPKRIRISTKNAVEISKLKAIQRRSWYEAKKRKSLERTVTFLRKFIQK